MIKHLKYLLFFLLFTFTNALEKETYSISVCTTSSKEDANRCKEDILKTSKLEAFILKNQKETYSTYLGVFTTYDEAKEILNNSSTFIKKQKPFIKKIEKNKKNEINLNTQENIKMVEVEEKIRNVDEEIKKLDEKIIDMKIEKEKALSEEQRKKANDENLKLKEEKDKTLAEFQKIEKEKALFEEQRKKSEVENLKLKEEKDKTLAEIQKIEKEKSLAEAQKIKDDKEKALFEEQRKKSEVENLKLKEEKDKTLAEFQKIEKEKALSEELHNLNNLDNFEKLLIKVDSVKNIMFLKGKNSNGEIIDIKTYKVSTAKTTVKKPLGEGFITSISLNPQWNPTNKTLKAFKEKGINLPSIVPFGDKLNYMGAAKINLSHKVDGQEVYRIHGTLSENTIGTNESGGCIRMKNKDVFELATLLNQYASIKNLSSIKVILF